MPPGDPPTIERTGPRVDVDIQISGAEGFSESLRRTVTEYVERQLREDPLFRERLMSNRIAVSLGSAVDPSRVEFVPPVEYVPAIPAEGRVQVPEMASLPGPTIRLDDVRNRRFNLINRAFRPDPPAPEVPAPEVPAPEPPSLDLPTVWDRLLGD